MQDNVYIWSYLCTLLKMFMETHVIFHPTLNYFCWNFGLNNDLADCCTQLLQNICKNYEIGPMYTNKKIITVPLNILSSVFKSSKTTKWSRRKMCNVLCIWCVQGYKNDGGGKCADHDFISQIFCLFTRSIFFQYASRCTVNWILMLRIHGHTGNFFFNCTCTASNKMLWFSMD